MNRILRPAFFLKIVVAFSLAIFSAWAMAAGSPPAEGGILPEMRFQVPRNPDERQYLGLGDGDSFLIPEIKCRVVIIEIYSLYCPYCQREASELNKLYQAIEGDSKLKGKIKMIGIGAGNSSFEVTAFREKYKVRFPLFPDSDYKVHKQLGEVRTPYFIAVKIKDDGSHQVIYSKLGSIKGVDQFLRLITNLVGL